MKILENILLILAVVVFLMVVIVVAAAFGIFSLIAIFVFAISVVIFLMLPVWKAILLLILLNIVYYFFDKYKLIWKQFQRVSLDLHTDTNHFNGYDTGWSKSWVFSPLANRILDTSSCRFFANMRSYTESSLNNIQCG